ncbi:Zinc transporter [Paecilomyces lecythidis]
MAASNDTRGWIMSAVSGVACVLGSSVICVDLIVRKCSKRKDFEIASNNAFLSASMSLSSGVLLMSSLYSMLPTSKNYLTRAGFSPAASAYTLIALFLAGVVVIRIVSAFLHRHIPSSIVDCEHTHNPDPEAGDHQAEEDRNAKTSPIATTDLNGSTERTPLLQRNKPHSSVSTPPMMERGSEDLLTDNELGKESLRRRWQRQLSHLLGGTKKYCDENGPCYGFSQKCGSECTKVIRRMPSEEASHLPVSPQGHVHVSTGHTGSGIPPETPQTPQTVRHIVDGSLTAPPNMEADGHDDYFSTRPNLLSIRSARPTSTRSNSKPGPEESDPTTPVVDHHELHSPTAQHHHHVPQNAFLSIGLQTSLAIALHKLPEGFITYATNHASPTLGLTVFIALFIHNITEGFAMALPLYLALNSRWKAILWSCLLGGVSQPAGAGIAALWIWGYRKAGGGGDGTASGTSWGVYGGMFAATAGVMTSVGLQLFSEGLGLTHNRNMCIGFAIAGMGVLGVSFALTA